MQLMVTVMGSNCFAQYGGDQWAIKRCITITITATINHSPCHHHGLQHFGIITITNVCDRSGNHELMGLGEYLKCGIEGVNFPLMCLFDYMGYRMVAISLVLTVVMLVSG